MPTLVHFNQYLGPVTDQVLCPVEGWEGSLHGLADMPPIQPLLKHFSYTTEQTAPAMRRSLRGFDIILGALAGEEFIERANELPQETISAGTPDEYTTPRLAPFLGRYHRSEFIEAFHQRNEVLFDITDHHEGHEHDVVAHGLMLATNTARSYRDLKIRAAHVVALKGDEREQAAKGFLRAVDFKIRNPTIYELLMRFETPESVFGALAGRDMSPEEGAVYLQEMRQRITSLGAHILGAEPSDTTLTTEEWEALGADHLHIHYGGEVQTSDQYRAWLQRARERKLESAA